nr:MAG TPA: hypothetical protein [Caudoviricetes sp.]
MGSADQSPNLRSRNGIRQWHRPAAAECNSALSEAGITYLPCASMS